VQGGNRPAGGQPQSGQRPMQGGRRPVDTARPVRSQEGSQGGNAQSPGWKSRNFMDEDDEFEFEFLNKWGDDES
ncbi:MAG: hypothetical protein NC081_11315, partial [Roseburia sp.]|nr:hypothetical protein [Roseburia sp.]